MKHLIKYLVFSFFVFSFVNCSDFLEEDFKGELAPDNTFTSTRGFEVGCTGLYNIGRSEYNTWGASAFMHNGACPYEALQISTDITLLGHGDGSLLPFANLTMTSGATFVESYWNWAYSLIAAANEILKYSEINTNWDNPSDKSLFQAEARFFRAYAYRTLVYLYGDVPYIDTINEQFRLDFTRTPKSIILEHMIDDLKFAGEHLYENPDDNKVQQGRLIKWAAQHLLSEIYILYGDYKLAAESALSVINSGYYELMENRYGANINLQGDVFSDLFTENNQNRSSGNKESIWVLQFEYNTTGGGGAYDDWSRRAWSPKYNDVTGFTLADTLGGRGLAQMVPMKWWIDKDSEFYDNTDIRNSEFNIKRNWYYNDPKLPSTYGKKAQITDETWFSTNTLFPALTKFFYGKAEDLSYMGSNKDKMKFRLAETYLLLSEAYLMQGETQKAVDAINVVRKRASASQVDVNQMTIDFLLDERIRELIGEESRRFTLIRTNKLIDRAKKYNSDIKDIIDEHHALWPIPQTIINSNRDAEFPQNPGYN